MFLVYSNNNQNFKDSTIFELFIKYLETNINLFLLSISLYLILLLTLILIIIFWRLKHKRFFQVTLLLLKEVFRDLKH
jgi:hypothetical protein